MSVHDQPQSQGFIERILPTRQAVPRTELKWAQLVHDGCERLTATSGSAYTARASRLLNWSGWQAYSMPPCRR